VRLFERPPGKAKPVGIAPFWKVAAEEPLQDVRCVAKACRLRQLADVAFDSHQTPGLDYRADIVEHAAGDRGRAGDGEQHGQDAPARGSNECCAPDAERGEDREQVGELDLQIIIRRTTVVLRFAAPAIIQREDKRLASAQEDGRQVRKIGRGGRQAGQTNDGQSARCAGTVGACVQPQPVLRGDEDASTGGGASPVGTDGGDGMRHRYAIHSAVPAPYGDCYLLSRGAPQPLYRPVMSTIEQGKALHQLGRVAEAEAVYRSVLARDPRQFDALHLLGLILYQRGRLGEAHDLLSQAVKLRPRSPQALTLLMAALLAMGRLEEAL